MNELLQQQLMEFVYDLLDEDEATALRERITSDPQVARTYAKVKLQCELMTRAARYDVPTVAWIRPDESPPSAADAQTASPARSADAYRRLASWFIGVAASGLVCLLGSAVWMSPLTSRSERTPRALATAAPVQVVVTGPSKLNTETSNPFTIQVEDPTGAPVSTTLNYRVYNTSGAVTWQDLTSTDESGVARFDVGGEVAEDASRLEITTATASPAPILRDLEAAPERFVTYLRMDRPLYQPSEPVHYRSVTLSRFGLQAEREVSASFEIVTSNDAPLEGSPHIVATEQGVGSGTFHLPANLPDGTYTLIARNPDNLFREEWRDFHVRRYETPRLLQKLELARDSYTAGDQVEFDFSAKRVAGEPLVERPLQIQATLDGLPLSAPQATTDAQGNSRFSLSLPETIERGEASVSVTVQEGDESGETITKQIPINLGKVNVDFYPEGGDLVGDLPNRVYFYGRDPLGKPTHLEGRIVDATGNEITNVVTRHAGRGVFSFTPAATEQYRLIIDKPVGVTKELPLPQASPVRFATIDTGQGVFDESDPIGFALHQRKPARPLIVTAYCRGAMVGQQTIQPDAYTDNAAAFATVRGELSAPAEAQGVIRLTVFDADSSPPEPIAERLVYRRVGQKLDVQITPDAETFAPGQSVELTLEVRDENETPIPAALGVAVVDDAVLNLADDKSVRMPTYFHLLTELDSPEQLEDANFYLSGEPESVAALDSLLGTQGWRRFRDLPESQLAQTGAGGFGGGVGDFLASRYNREAQRSLARTDETAVPLRTASSMEVRERSVRQATRPARAIVYSREALAMPLIIVSIVLLALVGFGSLRRVRSNRPLRIFAAGIAVVALTVGVLSRPMPPSRFVATGDAASATVGVPEAADERDSVMAAKEGFALGETADAEPPKPLMSKSGDMESISDDVPLVDAPIESGRAVELQQLAETPAGVMAADEERDPRALEGARGKPSDLLRSVEKKAAVPLPAKRPSAASESAAPTPTPAMPQPQSAAPFAQSMTGTELPTLSEKELGSRLATRQYAKWFYETSSGAPPTSESSSTIVWLPLHRADDTGRASVFFKLPPRPSRVRAIIEAHGAGRLGAGELLIDSR